MQGIAAIPTNNPTFGCDNIAYTGKLFQRRHHVHVEIVLFMLCGRVFSDKITRVDHACTDD